MECLVMKALVLGEFGSTVSFCLCAEQYVDAILLAVKGGPELFNNTQKAYFEKGTVNLPYLRLFQSIVSGVGECIQNEFSRTSLSCSVHLQKVTGLRV